MGQKPRDLTPTRSVLDFFGAELRTIRESRQMSMADLATALAYDPSQVGKVERAERSPTREFAAACDKALGTDGRLTRL